MCQSSRPLDWVREIEMRAAIRHTHAELKSAPELAEAVLQAIGRADTKRAEGESAYEILNVPGWEPIACVVNKYGWRYAVPADLLADYIVSQHFQTKETT